MHGVGGRPSALRSYRACASLKGRSSAPLGSPAVFLVSRPPTPLEFHCNLGLLCDNELGGNHRGREPWVKDLYPVLTGRSTLAPLLLGLPPLFSPKIISNSHRPHEPSILPLTPVRVFACPGCVVRARAVVSADLPAAARGIIIPRSVDRRIRAYLHERRPRAEGAEAGPRPVRGG
jgi:hypothetical protein